MFQEAPLYISFVIGVVKLIGFLLRVKFAELMSISIYLILIRSSSFKFYVDAENTSLRGWAMPISLSWHY